MTTIVHRMFKLATLIAASSSACMTEDDPGADDTVVSEALTGKTFTLGESTYGVLWTLPFNGASTSTSPDEVLAFLQAAEDHGKSVFVVYPRPLYTTNGETTGPYSGTKHRALSRAYADVLTPSLLQHFVGNGTLAGINVGDDYGCEPCWAGTKIPPSEARDAANYAKRVMPGAPIGVRVDALWMSQVSGWKIDYGWAQYVTRKGDQQTWYDDNAAAAAEIPVKMIYGVNSHDIDGGGPLGAASAEQLRSLGTRAINYPKNCAMISWRYDDADWARTDLRAAWSSLIAKAKAKPFVSCKRF